MAARLERVDGGWFATIPGCGGLWAAAPTPEEAIDELRSVFVGWRELKLADGDPDIPNHDDLPDPDQWWFWTDEWQAAEREADADIAAGRLTTFESSEALLAWLNSEESH